MKLNRTRSVTSLQPDKRNGHKPAVTTQFWGNRSVGIRGTERGRGKPVKIDDLTKEQKPWWLNQIQYDDATLRNVVPKVKTEPKPEKPKLTLDKLITAYTQRRSK